jgi:two-component sensor histidine kinase
MTAPLHILYIDDDLGTARLVQKGLQRLGHVVEMTHEGASGVQRVAQGGIDAVALDHYMPGQDGLVTLAAIRALPDPPPVIYVTAAQEGSIAVAALKAGAADYVVKDVAGEFLSLLMTSIEQAIESVRLRQAKEQADAEVRAARDRFEKLAEERDLLLREVNHRVGNSLQIISSFLHLQGSAATSADVKIALESARQRVMAVAQVHRRLYAAHDVKSIALDEYLKALAEDLRGASDQEAITLSLDAEPIDVEPDHAVAAGIIVTELVLNALKHAYPGGKGPIRMSLRADSPARARLSVEDDGIGRNQPNGVTRKGLGQMIVKAMASKLNAEWSYDDAHLGTRVTLCFDRSAPTLPAA